MFLRRLGARHILRMRDSIPHMHLSCPFNAKVTDIHTGTSYPVPGIFIELRNPEMSSVTDFWKNGGFKEVWTYD